MTKVYPLRDTCADAFKEMFGKYYLELDCEESGDHLAEEYIIPDVICGLVRADILEEDGEICGFCLYQTDSDKRDWNFKAGFGDIREIYIAPEKRRKGLGRFLLYTAEMRLREEGAQQIYTLPDDGASCDFFAACGYELTDEICEELECNVFIKSKPNACGH